MYEVTEHSTQFGYNTPHGFKTPHRYPVDENNSFTGNLMQLVRQLYPTGRAFLVPEKSNLDKLHKGLNVSMIRFLEELDRTINQNIPDNEAFTENDATLWEYRLGLTVNPPLTIEQRRQTIRRKMAYPSNMIARAHKNFLEHQLQLAGFDVYVHENGTLENGEVTYQSPDDILDLSTVAVQHGNTQHGGGTQHGSSSFEVIANKKENESYAVGEQNLWATFFIGGPNLGDQAQIPDNRKKEFRELVLKLKPAHLVAFLFINWI